MSDNQQGRRLSRIAAGYYLPGDVSVEKHGFHISPRPTEAALGGLRGSEPEIVPSGAGGSYSVAE